MIIHALSEDTGLSHNYRLETSNSINPFNGQSGVIVTVYLGRQCIGQFTNNRQGIGDTRPFDTVVKYHHAMDEVIKYFEKTI
jgi:hypothetical protein